MCLTSDQWDALPDAVTFKIINLRTSSKQVILKNARDLKKTIIALVISVI